MTKAVKKISSGSFQDLLAKCKIWNEIREPSSLYALFHKKAEVYGKQGRRHQVRQSD